MSVKVSLKGRRDSDGKLAEMARLAFNCDHLKCDYPPQVVEYFEGSEALDMTSVEAMIQAALEVDLKYEMPEVLSGKGVEYGEGVVIDLKKLPDDIVAIRVCMS